MGLRAKVSKDAPDPTERDTLAIESYRFGRCPFGGILEQCCSQRYPNGVGPYA